MQEWRGLRGSDRECLIGLWGLMGWGDTLADKRFLHFVKCCAAVIVATIKVKQVVKMTKFTKYRLYGQLKSGQKYASRWDITCHAFAHQRTRTPETKHTMPGKFGYLLLLDHASTKAALSFTVKPTLLTRPKRASASPTLSRILFSSALTSAGWSLKLANVSVLLVIAESSPSVSSKLVKYLSFFSTAASVGLDVL